MKQSCPQEELILMQGRASSETCLIKTHNCLELQLLQHLETRVADAADAAADVSDAVVSDAADDNSDAVVSDATGIVSDAVAKVVVSDAGDDADDSVICYLV